ncbi:BolA family transcriptional regulator [Allgaiera indica]|uniref:BolA family transcriptional regulator n=1 Tax=Allgaiera indica TaxID=765699 RepID=A0AAN4UPU7_9RHOB|nr:BolA family protein [Allgaiera indica]GHE00024.1 BolA family transcriptional regulator [Allgaiera indica]SDW38581.1 BolA protein [Allgaiera indica]
MNVTQEIQTRLTQAFAPDELRVIDESERHRGHAGYQEGGESHFRVTIKAPAFAEMSRIARHRAIHEALGPDLVGRIHALALEVGA